MDPTILVVVQGAFALLFALSAAEKRLNRETFQFNLAEYRIVPTRLVPLVSGMIIPMEAIVAILLVLSNPFAGVVIGLAMLSLYTLAIWINLLRGRVWMDCGCLGSSGEGLSYWLVLRNLGLIGILSLALLPRTGRSLVWLDYASIFLCVGALATAYIAINSLIAANTRTKMWWA